MICATQCRVLVLMAVVVLSGTATVAQRREATASRTSQETLVVIRWGVRPGVTRYRLQVANDWDFADIVFDRVVNGHEYQIGDLSPGKYFWRIASLDRKLGEFSSPGVIEISERAAAPVTPIPTPTRHVEPPANASSVATRNGWYAAFAEASRPILAHLRLANSVEVVATASDNRVIAIDGLTGVALWIRQLN